MFVNKNIKPTLFVDENQAFVNFFIISAVCLPETRITAIPEMPGPEDNAYIVIKLI